MCISLRVYMLLLQYYYAPKILYIMCIEYCMLCILFCPGIPHNNRNNNNSNDINGSRKAVEVIMLVFMH